MNLRWCGWQIIWMWYLGLLYTSETVITGSWTSNLSIQLQFLPIFGNNSRWSHFMYMYVSVTFLLTLLFVAVEVVQPEVTYYWCSSRYWKVKPRIYWNSSFADSVRKRALMCYIQCHVHLQIVCEWVSLLTAVIRQNAIVVENAASISIDISSTHLSKKTIGHNGSSLRNGMLCCSVLRSCICVQSVVYLNLC